MEAKFNNLTVYSNWPRTKAQPATPFDFEPFVNNASLTSNEGGAVIRIKYKFEWQTL